MGPGDMSNRDGDGARDQDPGPDSRRGAVIGLILVLVLVVIGYYLVEALRQNANLQDCVMSGRKNCAPIDVPPKR